MKTQLNVDSPRFCETMDSAITAAIVMSREMGLWTVRVYRLEDRRLLVQEERDTPPAGGVCLFDLIASPCACDGDRCDPRCPAQVSECPHGAPASALCVACHPDVER